MGTVELYLVSSFLLPFFFAEQRIILLQLDHLRYNHHPQMDYVLRRDHKVLIAKNKTNKIKRRTNIIRDKSETSAWIRLEMNHNKKNTNI